MPLPSIFRLRHLGCNIQSRELLRPTLTDRHKLGARPCGKWFSGSRKQHTPNMREDLVAQSPFHIAYFPPFFFAEQRMMRYGLRQGSGVRVPDRACCGSQLIFGMHKVFS